MTDNIKLPPMPESDHEIKVRSAAGQEWGYRVFSAEQMQAYAREAVRLNAHADIRALIADDAYAMTFQSLGQYRSALLAALSAAPSAPQPAQQPLTDERLQKMHHEDEFGLFCDYDDFEQIARAIEQAHGIGVKP